MADQGRSVKGRTRVSYDHRLDSVNLVSNDSLSTVPIASSSIDTTKLRKKKIDDKEKKAFGAFESFNYDQPENHLFEKSLHDRSHASHRNEEIMRWVVATVIGFVTSIVGFYVHNLTKFLEETRAEATEHFVEEGHVITAFLVYIGLACVFCTVAAILVAYIEPQAKGSGIPEVKSILNGNHLPRVIRFRTLISKTFGIAFSVGGGLFVGKEGPMVHSGSIVAAGCSQGPPHGFDWAREKLKRFRNDKDKRDFVSMGCAAGVAAAFGAPMGGLLFSFEEGSTYWDMKHTVRVFYCAMVTTSLMNFWLQFVYPKPEDAPFGMITHNSLYTFGAIDGPASYVQEHYQRLHGYREWEMVGFAVIGISCGLTGALYNAVNMKITAWRTRISNRPARVVEVLVMACITASLTFWVTYMWGCQTPAKEAGEFMEINGCEGTMCLSKFFCEEGEFNEMATLLFDAMPRTIAKLYHSAFTFDPMCLFVFWFVYFSISCITYGISIPSGLFIPTVIVGAGWGRLCGELMVLMTGVPVDRGAYALVGSVSFLGGVSRMTVSICVILLEASNNITYAMPMILASCCSKLAGDLFNHGLFDMHIRFKCVPFLEPEPEEEMRLVAARDVMAKPVVMFKEVVQVRKVVAALKASRHNGFPVIRMASDQDREEGTGQFVGIILRTQLSVLLAKKHFTDKMQTTYDMDANVVDSSRDDELLSWRVFEGYYPKFPDISEINLDDDDLDMYINLSPYLNSGAYTVRQGVKLDRIFGMVRSLGLRHLTVVDLANRVVGIITRKDLMPHKTAESLEVAQNQEIANAEHKRERARERAREMTDFA